MGEEEDQGSEQVCVGVYLADQASQLLSSGSIRPCLSLPRMRVEGPDPPKAPVLCSLWGALSGRLPVQGLASRGTCPCFCGPGPSLVLGDPSEDEGGPGPPKECHPASTQAYIKLTLSTSLFTQKPLLAPLLDSVLGPCWGSPPLCSPTSSTAPHPQSPRFSHVRLLGIRPCYVPPSHHLFTVTFQDAHLLQSQPGELILTFEAHFMPLSLLET